MADLPKLTSREQTLGQMINTFRALAPAITDLNKNAVWMQYFQAIASAVFRAKADVIAMVDASSPDRAVGEALQRQARDADVTVSPGSYSSGRVNITDLSFEKIASEVFAGQPAPVAGALTIYVADASKMPSTGSVYIGRGTTNIEGPLSYTSRQPEAGGSYWSITLATVSPTTKFHNIGETVIVAQGGRRAIPINSIVRTAGTSSISGVAFRTTVTAYIPDGETEVTGVPILATSLGIQGNVPRGAIRETEGLPFAASSFNPNALTNGSAPDDADAIRSKIKQAEQKKARGTAYAIQFAILGITSSDDLKTVQTANTIRYADNSSVLIFDDGAGYEPIFNGVGIEQIVGEAIGGEQELQLRKKPVAQARLVSIAMAPYAVLDNQTLSVIVDNVTTTHFFQSSDFKVPGKATAYEIAASINGDVNINFLANTYGNGTQLVIFPKDRKKNSLAVISPSTANTTLKFPVAEQNTLLLYKNDTLLNQEGKSATINSRSKSAWSNSIVPGDTLTYIVDETVQLTATFTQAIFRRFDIAATVSSFTDINTWVQVFNALMPGVVATVNGEIVSFSSARGESSDASLTFVGGTLLDKIFSAGQTLSVTGLESDYILNRQTSQIGLKVPLQTGDKVTAGSTVTRANVVTNLIPDGPTAEGNIWAITDGAAVILSSGIDGDSVTTFSRDVNEKITIEVTTPGLEPTAFDNALPGDWIVVWADPSDLTNYPTLYNFQGFWRIETAERGKVVVNDLGKFSPNPLAIPAPRGPGGSLTIPTDRIVLVRSDAPVQQLTFGVNTIDLFAAEIVSQLQGVRSEIVGSRVRISTTTLDESGELCIVACDSGGRSLGITPQSIVTNIPSQRGFVNTILSSPSNPSFTHGVIGPVSLGTEITQTDFEDLGGEVGRYLTTLNQSDLTGTVPEIITDSNIGRSIRVSDFNSQTDEVEIAPLQYNNEDHSVIQEGDRFHVSWPYQFDSTDRITMLVDNRPIGGTFTLPVARRISVNTNSTPTVQDFSASDLESSLELSNGASFSGFSFNDWKLWRQPHTVLTDGTYGIKIQSIDFGPTGESTSIGFTYPESTEQTTLQLVFTSSELNQVGIRLPVAEVRPTNITGNTSFTASVNPISADKEQVTYTYRIGDVPDFSQVQTGDIALINQASDFLSDNRGYQASIVAVSDITKEFTIERPAGTAQSDALAITGAINQKRVLTVTTGVAHQIEASDKIGLYNTSISQGSTRPMDGVYPTTLISSTQFSVPLPTTVPGGRILNASHAGNLISANTELAHGLTVGNTVLVSDFSITAYNGLVTVIATPTPNQFQYVRSGSSASVVNGNFDFQSYSPTTSVPLTSIQKVAGLVTIITPAPHGLILGDLFTVIGSQVDNWSAVTSYQLGDVVQSAGQNYKSLIAGTTIGSTPQTTPAEWVLTTEDFNTGFTVSNVVSATQIEAAYRNAQGAMSATTVPGTLSELSAQGSLARSVGSNSQLLQFVEVVTTAQEVVDFITQTYSDLFVASIPTPYTGSELITLSTEDQNAVSSYIDTTASNIRTRAASHTIFVTVADYIIPGSTVNLTNAAPYSGVYQVLDTVQSGSDWIIKLQSDIKAITSQNISVSGDVDGYTTYIKMVDGENFVDTTDLDATIGNPQFSLKRAWQDAPESGEEVRLVAYTNQMLVDFWQRLIVSGLSNLSDIETIKYGTEMQISTKTFGATGSVQAVGGNANYKITALVGAGSELSSRLGVVLVPYDLRTGLVSGNWIKLDQTVRQNKTLEFSGDTQLQTYANGLEIDVGPGSFQTKRTAAMDETTVWKVEKHGEYTAIIRISGTSPLLGTNGVIEGDWVNFINMAETDWASSVSYSVGDRVSFGGFNWTARAASGGVNPSVMPIPDTTWELDTIYTPGTRVNFGKAAYRLSGAIESENQYPTDPTSPWVIIWEVQEWAGGNTGLFQVIRTFGQDSFWIENSNSVEEICTQGNVGNLAFYSYDSVMPGDTLVIAGSILNSVNAGRYTVLDDTFGPGYAFPTSTRIYTSTIPLAGVSAILGDSFTQINVEENQPTHAVKRILGIGPLSSTTSAILLDTPNLVNKFSSSNAAYITSGGKLEMSTDPQYGLDAYKHYKGLIEEINRVVYGDPSNPIQYPGYAGAGADIEPQASIIKRILIDMSVRVKTGIPFSSIRESIKAAAAGYVNTLGPGDYVAFSKILEAVQKVPGVTSVVINFPSYTSTNDRIVVGPQERAFVIDPTNDITVAILGL